MMSKQGRKGSIKNRRRFLQASTLAIVAPALRNTIAAQTAKPFELEEMTIANLQEAMKAGKYTARQITEMYLARIDEIDKHGPAINSVIEINPDAQAIADALDRERKEKGPRGPLHGIPILIKDNIDTADRMMTTAGSLALSGSTPSKDAFVAGRLRAAGAVLLGKTNLSEWANFRSGHSTSGWSGRGGLTKNPYALDRNPCGSSSGSGAATAANLCAAAIGTETDGSIVCPSSSNSLVGIKPTLGLVSRAGIIPIAHSQDTAGPMARCVADAAALLGALTGIDSRDKATNGSRGKSMTDYTKFLDPDGMKGARIGVIRKSFGFNERVDKLLSESIEAMKRLGAVNAYLAGLGARAPVHSLKEIIEFNEQNRDKEMPYFGQEVMIRAEAKGPLTSPEYRKALAKNLRLSRTEGIDAVMLKYKLDALIAPTGGPPWKTDLINGDHFTGGFSTASAVAGYPHITVPAGYIYGLPVGISFAGRAYSEPVLIKLAYAYEQATKRRRVPQFLPGVENLSV
jgi:amidase